MRTDRLLAAAPRNIPSAWRRFNALIALFLADLRTSNETLRGSVRSKHKRVERVELAMTGIGVVEIRRDSRHLT